MCQRFPKDDLRPGLAIAAFTTLITGVLGLGGAGPDIGEKQNAYRGHDDHNKQPEVDTAFHCLLIVLSL